jgi:hypothetical protein
VGHQAAESASGTVKSATHLLETECATAVTLASEVCSLFIIS